MSQVHVLQHSITATITSTRNNEVWTVTGVYGPQDESAKLIFLQELRQIKLLALSSWALLGDFTLIYRTADKSNPKVNRRMMNQFRTLLDELEVKDLHLHVRHFTWTSGTANPTETKINHVFVSKELELTHPSCYLQALGTSVFDHCPMLLSRQPFHRRYKGFRFEASWLHMSEFKQIVQESWAHPVQSGNKMRALHIKLARLGKNLRAWSKKKIKEMRREADEAQTLILRPDQEQDNRVLHTAETIECRTVKDKILTLAVVRKLWIRQLSRLTWIKSSDANTKLFHLCVNARHRKNFILSLHTHGTVVTTQKDKAEALWHFYSDHFGAPPLRACTLKWGVMAPQRHDLADLDRDLTDEEIKQAVMQGPTEKAPGPDDFIGAFYKTYWDIIKMDISAALQDMFTLRVGC
jgi:hypothetical protein